MTEFKPILLIILTIMTIICITVTWKGQEDIVVKSMLTICFGAAYTMVLPGTIGGFK